MTSSYSILVDVQLGHRATALLKAGAPPDDLAFTEASSTWMQPQQPSALASPDIILGQPDVATVLACPELKWLHVTSAGYTRYDTPEFWSTAKERGLIVTNSSQVYHQACAEHALAFILAQARHLPESLAARHAPASEKWLNLRHSYRLLRGQSMIIFGYGAIAECLVGLLAPFNLEITGWRRKARGDEAVRILAKEELPEALAKADHVLDILPDNAATRHFFSAERFRQMKSETVFYNLGRGATVDQEALAAALRSGHLGAAWLDVTDPEPLPGGHPLLDLKNCYVTPHTAGGHFNEFETIVRHFLENLRRFRGGLPLLDRVV